LTSNAATSTAHSASITVGTGSDSWSVTTTIYMVATGGTITTYGNYKVHTFLSSGTFTVTDAGSVGTVDLLVVGQGGPSGNSIGGGGGGGGVVSGTGMTLSSDSYPIVVGASTASTIGTDAGDDSTALGQTAKGGGRAGDWSEHVSGYIGGSGGGGASAPAGYTCSAGATNQGAFQTTYGGSGNAYGNVGSVGLSASPYGPGGGGGGAGAVGTRPHGGAGIQIDWVTPQALGYAEAHNGVGLTTPFYWAGGGGSGSQSSTAGNGGMGGGSSGLYVYDTGRGSEGAGGLNTSSSSNSKGAVNTGGGAGADQSVTGADKYGGSGIVIIRYQYQ
jgi:hypothetical protein